MTQYITVKDKLMERTIEEMGIHNYKVDRAEKGQLKQEQFQNHGQCPGDLAR